MAQFEPLQAEIEQLGASLLFVAAEKREGMFKPERFFGKHPIPFPFLLDQDRSVTKAYGVHNRLALDAIHIAKPATFVVDRNGIVRFSYVGKNQLDRAPLEQVMEAVASCQPPVASPS
jgi:peroxiredoxin